MGNIPSSVNANATASTENKFDNFYEIIDYIASNYILTTDFTSLKKLTEKEYCDKLVALTSDIIERHFNEMEITYLAQRVKGGLEVNELNKEKLFFINKDNLQSLDVSNDAKKSIKKKRVCIGIAKFYIKVAHIFAAIMMTINPIYSYHDASGQLIKVDFMNKQNIPKNVNRKLYRLNICDNRIRALKRGDTQDGENVTLHPKICDINMDKSLADEPGITELMNLYLDDNYDYSNGTFTGMSEETKKVFMRDLKTVYTAFTGNESMPADISKFSDIKLRDYNKSPSCTGENPSFKKTYTVNKKDKLFVEYAENIRNMITNATNNQQKLLSVINILFTYVIDPYSNKKVIRINPKLNEQTLQSAIEMTRKFIIDLYVKCETDYVKGVKLYEAIVESKIIETTLSQIENLKKETSNILKKTSETVEKTEEVLDASSVAVNPSPILTN
jgi:hypothetical protein